MRGSWHGFAVETVSRFPAEQAPCAGRPSGRTGRRSCGKELEARIEDEGRHVSSPEHWQHCDRDTEVEVTFPEGPHVSEGKDPRGSRGRVGNAALTLRDGARLRLHRPGSACSA